MDWSETTLPLPEKLSVRNKSNTLRKKLESGRTLQRARFTTQFEEATVSFTFLNQNFQIFKGVWVHYLNQGVDWFTMDLPVGGQEQLTNCQVRFVSDYSYSYKHVGAVKVSAQIEFYEVKYPDELALSNLITVGASQIEAEYPRLEITWTNEGGDTDRAISASFGKSNIDGSVNPSPALTQWWTGVISYANGTAVSETLLGTPQAQEFRSEHWLVLASGQTEPNTEGLSSISCSNPYIKYMDLEALEEVHGWQFKNISLTSMRNWRRADGGDTWTFGLYTLGSQIRFGINDYCKNLVFKRKQPNPKQWGSYGITLSQLDNLETISFTDFEVGEKAKMRKFDIYRCESLTAVDATRIDMYAESNTGYFGLEVSECVSVTEITLPPVYDFGRFQLELDDNNIDTINTTGDVHLYYDADFTDNNLTLDALNDCIENFKKATSKAGTARMKLGNNPCWVANKLYPFRFGSALGITNISSTATDFTVTTSQPHSIVVGDTIQLGSTPNAYYNNGIFVVASIPTSNTFTVDDTTNAGSANSGWYKLEVNELAGIVEDKAIANGIQFIT